MLSENKSIWLASLFSEIFLFFKIKLGIELKIACLFEFKLSNAPAFTNPSNYNLFISLGLTLFIKSLIDLNFPFNSLSSTILEIAS